MGEITVNGEFDHLFFDDRIPAISQLKGGERILQYGANSLHPPSRKLTPLEIEQALNLGLPPLSAK